MLSDCCFSANENSISFSASGNQLIITATNAPPDSIRITANKASLSRRGTITWTNRTLNPGSGKQDVITYTQSVNGPVQAFLHLKVSYGSAKIVKISGDSKVDTPTHPMLRPHPHNRRDYPCSDLLGYHIRRAVRSSQG